MMITVACRRNNTDPDIPPNVNVMVGLAGPLVDLVDDSGNVIDGSIYSNNGYITGSSAAVSDPNNTYPDSSHFSLTAHYVYNNADYPLGTNVLTLGGRYSGRKGYLRVTGTRDSPGHTTLLKVEGQGSAMWDSQAFPPEQTNVPVTLDENGSLTYTTSSPPDIGSGFSYYSAATLVLGDEVVSALNRTSLSMVKPMIKKLTV